MNKLILSLFFLLATTFSFAQSYYSYPEKNISLGLSFDPNISWLSYGDNHNKSVDSKFGYSYGLVADLGFARNYYFSTGLSISTLNSFVYDESIANSGKDIRLQYAEVPLSIKLKTNGSSVGRFYGLFGFTAGVKVSGKEKLENSDQYQAISGDDIFRLGLQIGTGGEFRIGNSLSFLTGLTYNNGFTRAIKDGSPKTSYVALKLGLLF
ncbi:porin family protein [Sphingobacterium hungaricum]